MFDGREAGRVRHRWEIRRGVDADVGLGCRVDDCAGFEVALSGRHGGAVLHW